MADPTRPTNKKYYTVEEANAMLPLLRSILRDVTDLANDLRDRHARIQRLQAEGDGALDEAHAEELQDIESEFERGQERMREYLDELKKLQVELKDFFTGLIDFPSKRNGREVYLCWKLGEPKVDYWHDLHSGFAGRQPLHDSVES